MNIVLYKYCKSSMIFWYDIKVLVVVVVVSVLIITILMTTSIILK